MVSSSELDYQCEKYGRVIEFGKDPAKFVLFNNADRFFIMGLFLAKTEGSSMIRLI